MEASLKLLNQYVKVDDFSSQEIADQLTSIGHEVEGIHAFARGDKLVVGYVKEKVPHPDSDHLNVCQVEVGIDVIVPEYSQHIGAVGAALLVSGMGHRQDNR